MPLPLARAALTPTFSIAACLLVGVASESASRYDEANQQRRLRSKAAQVDRVWTIVATHPSGQQEHIIGFHSEAEAKKWRVSVGCEAWLRTRGYAGWRLRERMRLKRHG